MSARRRRRSAPRAAGAPPRLCARPAPSAALRSARSSPAPWRPKVSVTSGAAPNLARSLRAADGGAAQPRHHDPLAQPPAADERAVCPSRLVRLVGVDDEGAPAVRGQPLPDRRGRRERLREAHPPVAPRPLKRVEEAVIGRLDAAVETGVGGRGKLGLGAVETGGLARARRGPPKRAASPPPSTAPSAGGRGSRPEGRRSRRRRPARRGNPDSAPSRSTITSAPPRPADRSTASTTLIASSPAAAVARAVPAPSPDSSSARAASWAARDPASGSCRPRSRRPSARRRFSLLAATTRPPSVPHLDLLPPATSRGAGDPGAAPPELELEHRLLSSEPSAADRQRPRCGQEGGQIDQVDAHIEQRRIRCVVRPPPRTGIGEPQVQLQPAASPERHRPARLPAGSAG